MSKPTIKTKANRRLMLIRIEAIIIIAVLLVAFGIISGGDVAEIVVALFVALIICMFGDKYIVNYEKRTTSKR